jgi:hypothetical protein
VRKFPRRRKNSSDRPQKSLEELGYGEAVDLLEATLQEEKNTDKTLTGIGKSVVNVEAEDECRAAAIHNLVTSGSRARLIPAI